MIKYIISFVLIVIATYPAMAETETASMRSAVCKLLALQTQKANEPFAIPSAAYQAGVDSYGRSVVPATIGQAQDVQSIFIPIEVDLEERFNIPTLANLDETQIGTAEIKPDGSVMFGGNDVTNALQDWCRTPMADEGGGIVKPSINDPKIETPIISDIPAPIIPEITKSDGRVIAEDKNLNISLSEEMLSEVDQIKDDPVLVPLTEDKVQTLAVNPSDAIEILPTKAIPPLEIKPNTGSNDTNLNTQSDIITGTDFRDYNE